MKIVDLHTFTVFNLNSVMDLIIDTLQADAVTNDTDEIIEEYKMYDEEVENLLLSFVEDIFELILTVVGDTSTRALAQIQETKMMIKKSVHDQVGSKLIVSFSMLLSFLTLWKNILELSGRGLRSGKLQLCISLTWQLLRNLEKAHRTFFRRTSRKGFRRSRSMRG